MVARYDIVVSSIALLIILGEYHAQSFSAIPAPLLASNAKNGCYPPLAGPCPIPRSDGVTLASSSTSNNEYISDADEAKKDYIIEHITMKDEALLDVGLFRGLGRAASSIEHSQSIGTNDMSIKESIAFFMTNYDSNLPPHYEAESYFVALYNGTNDELRCSFAGQNGIVGIVSAQIRRRAPLIAGPSNSGEDDDGDDSTALPSVPLPSPHVYIANMRVDDKMRRKGIGLALLSSVQEYARSWSKEMGEDSIPLVLSVDSDNKAAIRLYERFGFEYIEKNDIFCMMIL